MRSVLQPALACAVVLVLLAIERHGDAQAPDATPTSQVTAVPAGRLVLRKGPQLTGVTVFAIRDGAVAGSLEPNVLETLIDLPPGSYEIRAGYVVGHAAGAASSQSLTVSVPLHISVTPRAAHSAEQTLTVDASADHTVIVDASADHTVIVDASALAPVIVDVALAELDGLSSAPQETARLYAGVCGSSLTRGDWHAGELCANLAYVRTALWAEERAELDQQCKPGKGAGERCQRLEEREKIWTEAIQGTLARGCKLGSPRACAAWDGASQEMNELACRAGKSTSWVACLRHFARDERPLFYDRSIEPRLEAEPERPVVEDDMTVRVSLGASVWRSPERRNPLVILPFALRMTLLGGIGLGKFGVTSTFGPTIQHLPVLERGSKEIVGSFQLIGLQGDIGWSWSPFSFIRFDGTFFFNPAFNQSASTLGVKAEGALVIGDHELSALIGHARVPNLGRDSDGSTRANIGGADLRFFGVSYFYAIRED